jgi:ABC-type bacteriocin/lantibiotic exporter with double-glycine peptidase domain
MLKLARVKPYQQETQQSCSAACLHSVLLHHGMEVPEDLLRKAIAVGRHGAELYQIVGAARALGMKARQVEFKQLGDAIELVQKDIPLICDVQSWTKPGSGHYVVLASVGSGRAEVMDPNVKGNWRSMPVKEFDDRWWDGDNVFRHKILKRAAVVIEPR